MKKYLVILFYTFIILLSVFTIARTETYAITENETIENQIDNNTVKNGNNTENEEQEIVEEEQEVIEEDNSNYVDTSTDDYYEDYTDYSNDNYDFSVNYGTYGRLYLYGHDVALYDYNVYNYSDYSLQAIVDNYDSAAYYRNKGRLVIADHNYQGFSILNYLSEGDTAYIEFEDGSTISYTMIYSSGGYNTGPDLVDYDGNSFFYMESDLIMYTCYNDGIMVTLWVLS